MGTGQTVLHFGGNARELSSFTFFRAMHYAKRCLVIACRLPVRLSVTLVDHDHIHLLPGGHGEILGRLEVGVALVRSFGTAYAKPFVYVAGSYLYCWIMQILHQYCTTKAHRAVNFAIAQLSCLTAGTQFPLK